MIPPQGPKHGSRGGIKAGNVLVVTNYDALTANRGGKRGCVPSTAAARAPYNAVSCLAERRHPVISAVDQHEIALNERRTGEIRARTAECAAAPLNSPGGRGEAIEIAEIVDGVHESAADRGRRIRTIVGPLIVPLRACIGSHPHWRGVRTCCRLAVTRDAILTVRPAHRVDFATAHNHLREAGSHMRAPQLLRRPYRNALIRVPVPVHPVETRPLSRVQSNGQ